MHLYHPSNHSRKVRNVNSIEIERDRDRRGSLRSTEWLGAKDAARYLGLPSRRALYQAIRRGQVPVHRLGARRMRFRRAELDQVLEEGHQGSVLHSS